MRESRRKAKNLSRMKKQVISEEKAPTAHLQALSALVLGKETGFRVPPAGGSRVSADSWFHPMGGTLRESEDQHGEVCFLPGFCLLDSVLLPFPLQRQPSPPSTAFTLQAVLGHSIPPVLDQREAIISYFVSLIKCSGKCPSPG